MGDKTLARRAVACKHWKWMDGMAYEDHAGVLWRVTPSGLMGLEGECLPVLHDPATKGCLLVLIREAWGDPSMAPHMVRRNTYPVWKMGRIGIVPTLGEYRKELEAMVAALEQAPARRKGAPTY